MIEFRFPLPSCNIDGRHNGIYNNEEMGYPCILTTLDRRLGQMIDRLRLSIIDDRRLVFIDGRVLMCSKNWIRDHVHEMKGFCHWEYDMTSFLNYILDTQRDDGCYYELIKQLDDYHWQYVNEDCRIIFPEDNLALVRLEIEADIEYLVVEGAMDCYRVTGDIDWLKKYLPRLEKGIEYITSSPKRWDEAHGLVKRALTIDTWDFAYREPGTNRRISDGMPMGIMHGDNSGVYQAMNQLAYFNRLLGNTEKAVEWEKRAEQIRTAMFRYLWNGKFFIHTLYLGDGIDDKESERLSLSNTYDMNRGVTNAEQSRSIIEEYMARRKTTQAFAEWFSIDPPYEPSFLMGNGQSYAPGKYVNGAISPFTAGELALAAFNNGYEAYGWDIIKRFEEMTERDGTIYFLYSPHDGTRQGGGPSAWGAAALLNAIDCGLAGIVNTGVSYDSIAFSPRFPVTEYDELRYITGYELTHATVDVRYIRTDRGMRYQIKSPARTVNAHILLPHGKQATAVKIDENDCGFTVSQIGDSVYADFSVTAAPCLNIEVLF